jgi:hypothetical protein
MEVVPIFSSVRLKEGVNILFFDATNATLTPSSSLDGSDNTQSFGGSKNVKKGSFATRNNGSKIKISHFIES